MAIEQEMRGLAERLKARTPTLARAIHERTLAEVPEFHREGADPALLAATLRSVAAALDSIFDGLGRGRTLPVGASGGAIEEARLAAQTGIELYALLRTYRVGQALTWEAILEEAEQGIADRATRTAVLTLASRYHFEWNDRIATVIVDIYQQERDGMFRDRERQKREFVRDVLRGLPVDASKIRYDLRATHLAVIAWGVAPDAAIGCLTQILGGAVITVPGSGGAVHGWIGGAGNRAIDDAALAQASLPPDTGLAVGAWRAGIDGFRESHSEALRAYRVARVRGGVGVARYEDVSLEALALADLGFARAFVDSELRPLAGDGHRERGLRATLEAYFATGHNATSAARLLGVHERTIAYRLRSVEQRLGFPIARRRDELAVALRLHRFIDEVNRSGFTTPVEPETAIDV